MLPLIQWTTVRLVVSENDWRRHDSEMEPQGRGNISPLPARRRNRTRSLSKTTLEARGHVQTVGLNAERKNDRHRADGEIFLLTFPFIGLLQNGINRDLRKRMAAKATSGRTEARVEMIRAICFVLDCAMFRGPKCVHNSTDFGRFAR